MMKWPRSRTRPVPQHRAQVGWTIGAARLLWIEKRFPNVIFDTLFVSAIVKANENYQHPFNASPEGCIRLDSKAPESATRKHLSLRMRMMLLFTRPAVLRTSTTSDSFNSSKSSYFAIVKTVSWDNAAVLPR
jgi:hypothetical protein